MALMGDAVPQTLWDFRFLPDWLIFEEFPQILSAD
jgi:hypothetical protein